MVTAKKNDKKRKPGRPFGATNKATSDIRHLFVGLIENNFDKIQTELDKLHGTPFINGILACCEYGIPKLKSVELVTDEESNAVIIIKPRIKIVEKKKGK